jgi:GNAT superfamily N-acetyltransferase
VTFTIRAVGTSDRAEWEPLWKGYQDFYARDLASDTTDLTWTRLTATHEIHGLMAGTSSGESVGLVHFVFHPATSTRGDNCYIPDLFVAPAARRHGVARELIAAVVKIARENDAAVVYWQTEEFNGNARRVYEKIAKRSPFIRYQIDL